jgi:hypothetical protein
MPHYNFDMKRIKKKAMVQAADIEIDADILQRLMQPPALLDPPQPQGDKPKQEVKMIQSFYGGMFPELPAKYWFKRKPFAKPIYYSELNRFDSEYGLCMIKGVHLRLDKLVQTHDGRWISKELADGAGWGKCCYSNKFYPKDELVEVFDQKKNAPILISVNAKLRCYNTCNWSGKLYVNSALVKISGSVRYKYVMRDYIEGNFRTCDQCGEIFENAHVKERVEFRGAPVCIKCYNKHVKANIILRHNADTYPPPIETLDSRLGHVVRGGLIWATMKPEPVVVTRMYGVEVETEISLQHAIDAGMDRFSIAKEIYDGLGRDFIMIKEDGSLTMNGKYSDATSPYGQTHAGFEIVSAPAGIEVHRARWPAFGDLKVHKLLRSWDCATCGFHIHVSRDSLQNSLVVGRMLVFLNSEKNRRFIWKVAGRSEVKFTKYTNRKLSDGVNQHLVINEKEENNHDKMRRVALNVSNGNTVEIRIFRGTINPRHIIRNIEFYDSMIEFCMPYARSLNDLGYKHYIRFVDENRKRWPLLAAWLAFHELISLKKVKRPEKVNTKRLTLKMDDVPEAEILV